MTLAYHLTFDSALFSKMIDLFGISRWFKRLAVDALIVIVSPEVTRFEIYRFSKTYCTSLLLRKHDDSFALLLLFLLHCALSSSARSRLIRRIRYLFDFK